MLNGLGGADVVGRLLMTSLVLVEFVIGQHGSVVVVVVVGCSYYGGCSVGCYCYGGDGGVLSYWIVG